MGPDQIATMNSVSQLIQVVGTLPIGTLLVLVTVGPWITMVFLSFNNRAHIDRIIKENAQQYEGVVKMYESNVRLVESYEAVVKQSQQQLDLQQELIMQNVKGFTELKGRIDNNLFCPWVRSKGKPGAVHG